MLLAASIRAERLKELIKGRREALELSQEDVAAALEITARAYGNWERGRIQRWDDKRLYALATVLQMTDYQVERLFWITVERDPQPDWSGAALPFVPDAARTEAFLRDYATVLEATSLPTFLIDHRWEVRMANRAYRDLFLGVRPHPTAMPTTNFLRFGLFHPDATSLLADHQSWQLAMLAQLAEGMERHDQDPALLAIRNEVFLQPALLDAYLYRMPTWLHSVGTDLAHYDGAVRQPNGPKGGRIACRIVEEAPRQLQALGLTRINMVLTGPDDDHLVDGAEGSQERRERDHAA